MLGICLRSRPWVPRCLIYWTSLWFVSLTDCCMCSKPWSMWRPRQLQWWNCWNCFWLRCSKRGHIWGILIPIYYGVESICAVPASQTSKIQISGFVKLTENNYLELLNAVAQIGPIAISVDASTWHAYDGGIYNGCNQTTSDIDHAVVLVGYGPGYWLVRNSWSASWGEAGYIKLYRDDNEEFIAPLMWHLWTEQLVLAKLIQSQPVVPAASFMTQLILLT